MFANDSTDPNRPVRLSTTAKRHTRRTFFALALAIGTLIPVTITSANAASPREPTIERSECYIDTVGKIGVMALEVSLYRGKTMRLVEHYWSPDETTEFTYKGKDYVAWPHRAEIDGKPVNAWQGNVALGNKRSSHTAAVTWGYRQGNGPNYYDTCYVSVEL